MLKRCKSSDQPDAPVHKEREEAFFRELHAQLAAINRYFQIEANRTVAAYRRSTKGIYVFFCFVPFGCFSGPKQYAALANRAYWCRKYARANAVALRKILKKHDKVCGNGRGREFLQQCWCSASADGIGLFLHSPLLDELKAVQDVLQQKINDLETHTDADEGHDGDHVDSDAEKGAIARKGKVSTAHPQENVHIGAGNQRGMPVVHFSGDNAAAPSLASPRHLPLSDGTLGIPAPGGDHPSHLARDSSDTVSHSSDGLRGATALAPSYTGSLGSITSPSLKAQRTAALAAIQESPTCMLDSSDIEWETDSPRARDAKISGGKDITAATSSQWPTPFANSGPQQQQATSASSVSTAAHAAAAAAQYMHHDNHHLHDATTTSGAGALEGIDPDAPMPSPSLLQEESTAVGGLSTGGTGGGGGCVAPGGKSPGAEKPTSTNQAEAGGYGSSTSGNILGPFRDEELRCPICLDLMYKPVGLGCGHKFCRPCALEAAGFGRACGAFRNIISYIPTRTRCPHCRQKNVYKNAVELKEVGILIRTRYPEQWAERRAEDRRRKQEISIHNGRIQRERINSLLGTTPFDLINGITPAASGEL